MSEVPLYATRAAREGSLARVGDGGEWGSSRGEYL